MTVTLSRPRVRTALLKAFPNGASMKAKQMEARANAIRVKRAKENK